jgi:hypothetical protein
LPGLILASELEQDLDALARRHVGEDSQMIAEGATQNSDPGPAPQRRLEQLDQAVSSPSFFGAVRVRCCASNNMSPSHAEGNNQPVIGGHPSRRRA